MHLGSVQVSPLSMFRPALWETTATHSSTEVIEHLLRIGFLSFFEVIDLGLWQLRLVVFDGCCQHMLFQAAFTRFVQVVIVCLPRAPLQGLDAGHDHLLDANFGCQFGRSLQRLEAWTSSRRRGARGTGAGRRKCTAEAGGDNARICNCSPGFDHCVEILNAVRMKQFTFFTAVVQFLSQCLFSLSVSSRVPPQFVHVLHHVLIRLRGSRRQSSCEQLRQACQARRLCSSAPSLRSFALERVHPRPTSPQAAE